MNVSNVEDDEYETPILAYSRELDSLVSVSYIIKSPKEEGSFPPHIEDVMTHSKEEVENTLPPF
jgi:hypothetical protein